MIKTENCVTVMRLCDSNDKKMCQISVTVMRLVTVMRRDSTEKMALSMDTHPL